MNRRKFLGLAGTGIALVGGAAYLASDRNSFVRNAIKDNKGGGFKFQPFEKAILYLASLAPSGHNTQPWLVKYMAPYHWIIANDKTKWLPAVDPAQRETILSLGAFVQNLEYAAAGKGFNCRFTLLATNNQAEDIMELRLNKVESPANYDVQKIKRRRTVRSNYLSERLKAEDVLYLTNEEKDCIHFVDNSTKEHQWLNEQTIEANRIQTYRNDAQKELAEWMRFSSKEAEKHCDGLTTASMELKGVPAWVLRNFYDKENVMSNKFREQGLDKVKQQVASSAGWLVITSKDSGTASLIEAGKRMQRLFLKIRERNIAIHPMTQILEEAQTQQAVNKSLGITDTIQFLLRTGYVKNYPDPVSLRRPVDWFIKTIA
jgi:hypothetical protein